MGQAGQPPPQGPAEWCRPSRTVGHLGLQSPALSSEPSVMFPPAWSFFVLWPPLPVEPAIFSPIFFFLVNALLTVPPFKLAIFRRRHQSPAHLGLGKADGETLHSHSACSPGEGVGTSDPARQPAWFRGGTADKDRSRVGRVEGGKRAGEALSVSVLTSELGV